MRRGVASPNILTGKSRGDFEDRLGFIGFFGLLSSSKSSGCWGCNLSFQGAKTSSDVATGAVTIGVLFFIFGFVTWLNGPLVTFVKLAFDLDDVNAFLVPMAFYLSYFFLALPASAILRRTGMKQAWPSDFS